MFVTCLKILTVTPSSSKALFHCGHIVHIVNYIIGKMTKWSKDSKSKSNHLCSMYVSNCWDSGSVGRLQLIQPLSKGTEQKEKTCCQQKSLNSSLNLFLPRWCQPSQSQTGNRTLRPTVLIWGVQQVKVSLQEHTQGMTQQGSSIPSPIKIKSTSIIVKHHSMLSKVNLGLA